MNNKHYLSPLILTYSKDDNPIFSTYSTTASSFSPLPSPQPLIQRFHAIVKYLNIPDILHGLENFGYISPDQTIEIYDMIQQLREMFPTLSKVLEYEESERPICAGNLLFPFHFNDSLLTRH